MNLLNSCTVHKYKKPLHLFDHKCFLLMLIIECAIFPNINITWFYCKVAIKKGCMSVFFNDGSSNCSQIDCVCGMRHVTTKYWRCGEKSQLTSANYVQIAQTAPDLWQCLPHYPICIIHLESATKTTRSTCK